MGKRVDARMVLAISRRARDRMCPIAQHRCPPWSFVGTKTSSLGMYKYEYCLLLRDTLVGGPRNLGARRRQATVAPQAKASTRLGNSWTTRRQGRCDRRLPGGGRNSSACRGWAYQPGYPGRRYRGGRCLARGRPGSRDGLVEYGAQYMATIAFPTRRCPCILVCPKPQKAFSRRRCRRRPSRRCGKHT